MRVDVVVPELGESVTDGMITSWRVRPGDAVRADQPLFELETDKVTAEVPSPAAGVIVEVLFSDGAEVQVGAVVARIDTDRAGESTERLPPPDATAPPAAALSTIASMPALAAPVARAVLRSSTAMPLPPATRRIVDERQVDPAAVPGTGKRGQVLKSDVEAFLAKEAMSQAATTDTTMSPPPAHGMSAPTSGLGALTPSQGAPASSGGRSARRVPMTRLRRRIAERLKEVQNTAAILTTFNEVDMAPVMALRDRYKERFEQRHGVKLGFMSFFVKATVEALKEYPALNGGIDGSDLLYHDYFDIGVAVSTERGLVVPVLRDADRLSMAEIEKEIARLGKAGRDGTLTLDELSGGTFSITNGGVFGSMLSTPILNPPQSGILGMHNIVKRPVVVSDEIVVRPVMYVALSYDHRIVDGAQAVRFLVKVKELIEDPARLLLEV